MGDKDKKRDPILTYNKFTTSNAIKKFNNLYLKNYFLSLEISPKYIIFDDIHFYSKLQDLILNESIEKWKEYLYFCLLNSLSPYLNEYYENNYFFFYGKILSGQKKMKPLKDKV